MKHKIMRRCSAVILAMIIAFCGISPNIVAHASWSDGEIETIDKGQDIAAQDTVERETAEAEKTDENIEDVSDEGETLDSTSGTDADIEGSGREEEPLSGQESAEEPEVIDQEEDQKLFDVEQPGVQYEAHVAKIGWQDPVKDGEIAGTFNRSLTIEALKLNLVNVGTEELQGSGIEYKTHVQSIGWQDPVKDGELSGTTGKSKRVEAVTINLTGPIAEKYDVYYRVHIQTYGWLDWASNGAKAGSAGYGKRLEAIEIRLVARDGEAPENRERPYVYPRVSYQGHAQSFGWMETVRDDEVAGTVGKSKRLEAFKVQLPDSEYSGGIQYRAHVQSIGWQNWTGDGQIAGTSGQSKRIEAVEMKLTGEMANYYDVYYSVHMAKVGWSDYVANGATAGTTGLSKPVQAIRIQLVKKGAEASPNQGGMTYVQGYGNGDFYFSGQIKGAGSTGNVSNGGLLGREGKQQQLQNITLYLNRSSEMLPSGGIRYATHVAGSGWTDWSYDGNVSGSQNASRGLEAVKIVLTDDMAKYYDIYYRTHVQAYGWLGWAKNGQEAGTTGCGYRLEALQIQLVSKDVSGPGANTDYFKNTRKPVLPADQQDMMNRANLYASSTPYLILVNRSTHRVGIFSGSQGNWDYIQYWPCSDGAPGSPTVSGEFTVQSKGYYFDSGASRCYWYTQFYGNYLFHSVLYNKNGTLMDGRLGMALSHGCVRLEIGNAKWIYDNIPRGTKVVVY